MALNISGVGAKKWWLKTKHKELRVVTSAEQAVITPESGKRLRVYGFQASQMVTVNLNASLRASLSFGTNGVSDASKVLLSFRQNKADDSSSFAVSGLNVVGEINEVVALTNITFVSGTVVTRVVVYYNDEE